MSEPSINELGGVAVTVAGAGVSGLATVRALLRLGADVRIVDTRQAALDPAVALGATGILLAGPNDVPAAALDGTRLVVTSPGWRPDAPLLVSAAERGIPVWGDVELAWRLDQSGLLGPARTWLAITGTNGKTTTTTMVQSILRAAGLRSAACGNIGLPLLDALAAGTDDEPGERNDVLAIELSSFQLHWAPSVRPAAGVILNIAEDHLDWHGGMDSYTVAKLQAVTGDVGVLGLDDPVAGQLGDRATAGRVVGFRLGAPAAGELGIEDGYLVDRAFADDLVLLPAAEVRPGGRPGLLDGLAAAALARAIGIGASAIAEGLRSHETGPHRNAIIATVEGIRYVDDSKATNPHAAEASLTTYDRVVWIAGGLLKGASVEDLVPVVRERLAAAIVMGADRAAIIESIQRHAPEVPVVEVAAGDDGVVTATLINPGSTPVPALELPGREGGEAIADAVMHQAVAAARVFAQRGDAIVLAPAAASLDMFRDYGHRGRSFAEAVTAGTQS
ncbi:UDP-N-acetylmuramoyl-L-alanine--D-glutamate ligase [Hoyosella sp. G463]|uniref:UDP-N-acetylmuramoylalanine--D-glutamate ligase n=1 Tax=Lolliginicoccus lacisalsi TaxID=2742202 RepID=A0A927JEM8_9ACTN|nr:UDP-N-acetylmuramoyl-L-alanine--D-glutamate ligase [Lolliginicoccus lacisalsi]MBD8507760.1 UDP-N-acetylmuramoyl-L-alanine--D-glutamate ligase [Lolliginicoccus lacisalsi]